MSCGKTKVRVLLVAMPSDVSCSMISYPCAVPGTLTMTFGLTAWISWACFSMASPSKALRGSHWPERKPSL